MVTIKYIGPANEADFSSMFGKPRRTEKYVFVKKGVYTLSNADAEQLLTHPRPINDLQHRFDVLASDHTDIEAPPPAQPQPKTAATTDVKTDPPLEET